MQSIQSDSTKVTFTQVYQDVKGALSAIGESLKTGSEHVYEVLVRQQVVNSITYSILILFGITITVILLGKAHKEKQTFEDSAFPGYLAFGVVIGVITLIGICATMDNIVTGFVNPEYGAIQEIREFIK